MKSRARIAWVIPTMRVGGTEVQLLHLMRGLVQDFDLTLICTRSEGALIGDVRRIGAYIRVLDYKGGWDFRMGREIYNIFYNHTPHVLHTFLSGFDLFANRAARKAGVPAVLSSRRELAEWQKPRHLRIQRKANTLVDGIVANSRAVANYAIEREGIEGIPVHIIHNGIRADDFVCQAPRQQLRARFRLPEHGYIIGMVANFSPVKDHQLFIDMAEHLLARRKDVHFLLVGMGPLVERIGKSVERRGQSAQFSRLSSLGEVRDLLGVIDLAVLTSKMEGFPNAVMEAMGSGTPIVAANVGGVGELVQDGVTGLLIDSRDPEDFARAVSSLLDDPDRASAMAARAAAWVRQELPVERMVEQYRNLYHELLQAKLARQA